MRVSNTSICVSTHPFSGSIHVQPGLILLTSVAYSLANCISVVCRQFSNWSCIHSLHAQNYRRLEPLVVDHNSCYHHQPWAVGNTSPWNDDCKTLYAVACAFSQTTSQVVSVWNPKINACVVTGSGTTFLDLIYFYTMYGPFNFRLANF